MSSSFMPHGTCFAWRPDVVTLHVISDALIALAYFSIPALLIWFVRKRKDLGRFAPVFWMFGVFIVACGSTHVLAIWTIWHPDYWFDGAVKALTAAASVGTAVMLVPLLPLALSLRSPAELERVNHELEDALHELEREHHIASTLQTAALSTALPDVQGLTFSAMYEPAQSDLEIGGDWYDAFPLGDGRIAVTIGDVTGSGLGASVIMAKVRQSLRAAAFIQVDPGAILDAADRALRSEYPDRVVTAFLGIIDQVESTFTFASAGHPWPLLRRADGTIEELASIALPLGLRDRAAPRSLSVALLAGDTLVLYTDGLIESRHDLADGEARLLRVVRELDPALARGAARSIADAVLQGTSRDDVAVLTVTVSHTGSSPGYAGRWVFNVDDGVTARLVRATVIDAVAQAGGGEQDRFAAEMIFSELVGNVLRYAPGRVEVILDTSGEEPVLNVLDRGPGFHFVAKLPSDLYSERGRGLFLVSTLADDFHIVRRPSGGSHARAVLPIARRALTSRRTEPTAV